MRPNAVGGFTPEAMAYALQIAAEEERGVVDFAYAERIKKAKCCAEGADEEISEEDEKFNEFVKAAFDTDMSAEAIVRLLDIYWNEALETP